MIYKARLVCIVLTLVLATLLSGYGLPGAGAQSSPPERDLNLGDLGKAIEESIVAEKSSLESFSGQLEILNHEKIYFAAALHGYERSVSTYESLLLATGVAVTTVQKVQSEMQASINEVQKMIDEIEPRSKFIALAKSNIIQQKNLSSKQANELLKMRDNGKNLKELRKHAQELAGIISKKEKLIEQLDEIITTRQDQLNRLKQAFS